MLLVNGTESNWETILCGWIGKSPWGPFFKFKS